MNPDGEEDLIEADIQQLKTQTLLKNVISQSDEYELEEKLDEVEMVGSEDDELDVADSNMPDSIQKYLNVINKRSEGLEKDLEECELLLKDASQEDGDEFYYQSAEMKELAFVLGEDPDELRDRVLSEVEDEERKESDHVRDHVGGHLTDPETDLGDKTDLLHQQLALHTTGELTMFGAADFLEQKAWKDLLELDNKLKQQERDMLQEAQHQILQQTSRDKLKDQNRSAKQKQHSDELKQLQQQRQIFQEKAEQELELESKKRQEDFCKHQAEIERFAQETEKEKQEFEHHLAADREFKQRQRLQAATLIQAAVRSYRVRRKYLPRLKRLREERQQRQLQNRQMEIVALRRAEEQRRKREREEKKKKEEEERRRKEEIRRRELEERQKQERLEKERIDQERKRIEMLEKQKREEEKHQHEEQLKKEREVEERTQEILSKIKNETNSTSKVTDEKLTDNERVDHVDVHDGPTYESVEVFLTKTQESQTLKHKYTDTDLIEGQPANTSIQTSNQIMPDKTLDTSLPANPAMDVQLQNHNSTSSQEADRGSPKLISGDSVRECITKKEAAATILKGSTLQVLSETIDVYPDRKGAVLDSDAQCNAGQAILEKVKSVEDLHHQKSNTNLALGANLEARRLLWIQGCVSLRCHIKDVECKETRRPLRRVHGANKLPALKASQLLAASQPGSQLSQVTTVMVENSPPFSLSSLTTCPRLICLHIEHCGVVLLEGLDQCADISYIDLQHNKVEALHCWDKAQLTQLMLQDNKLTSTYGLDGCTQLRYVQLCKNNITRTGGLESLTNITHLDISHNQLVGISGIGQLVHLQDLNLSHNHLSSVQELHTCCLLQRLNIESNSLVEMPPVQDHVLLNNLRLSDNSISHVTPLSQAWLPMLQHLSLAQNGIFDLADIKYCLMLTRLDISHNCITDMNVIVEALRECYQLQDLCLEGNPVTQEDQYRCTVLGTLTWLHVLDHEAVMKPVSIPSARTPLERMCLSQLHVQDKLRTTYQQHTASIMGKSASSILQVHQVRDAYMKCSLEQAIAHRCMHETADLAEIQHALPCSQEAIFYEYISMQTNTEEYRTESSNVTPLDGCNTKDCNAQRALSGHSPVDDTVNVPPGRQDSANSAKICDHSPTVDHTKTMEFIAGVSSCDQMQPAVMDCIPAPDVFPTSSIVTQHPSISDPSHQTHFVGPSPTSAVICRPDIDENRGTQSLLQQNSHAATVIQARWKGYLVRRNLDVHAKQYLAALRIQALWRGFKVRKMVALARQAVRYHDSEDEDEAMFYDEVDPAAWDFAQANVDSEWLPSDTPSIPRIHPCVPATQTQVQPVQALTRHDIPEPPRQAWYASPIPPANVYTSRNSQSSPHLISKPPIPPVHSSPASDTPRTTKSHKQDQISQEWGFKDSTTAELMMKRAKKLSKGAGTHKKKALDPLQRYQHMKKVHDSTRVVPSPKRGVQRQEFFQAREQEIQNTMAAQRKEKEHKDARTLEWVHSHTGVPDDMLQEYGRQSSSEPNLPAISPNAIQGRVQLMASPLLELQSIDGASSVSSTSHRPRSHSFSSHSHEELRLPAIKTNSAPSGRTRERGGIGSNRPVLKGWTSKR
ncbi:leucine-rich repeat and IQ domain-containing protein 1-like [Acanthaster planci]|uniref:Leucine-rich repeat and IQ domain-containing protein 1-like n=1 Tax=Acanthaster planci TaxID=133434 RepID=A0A8B7ZTA2_ACAPL|nr:leucine-rich repeat and IQ domain-containing protein 1-like [Acanthaster planci]